MPDFERFPRRPPLKSRAAVALAAGQPLQILEIDVARPRKGEVLVRITHTGVCHTDAFTLSGSDGGDPSDRAPRPKRFKAMADAFMVWSVPELGLSVATSLATKIERNAIEAGMEKGRAQYLASLTPGRETRQRDFRRRQRQQRAAQAHHDHQVGLAPQSSTTPDVSK